MYVYINILSVQLIILVILSHNIFNYFYLYNKVLIKFN